MIWAGVDLRRHVNLEKKEDNLFSMCTVFKKHYRKTSIKKNHTYDHILNAYIAISPQIKIIADISSASDAKNTINLEMCKIFDNFGSILKHLTTM